MRIREPRELPVGDRESDRVKADVGRYMAHLHAMFCLNPMFRYHQATPEHALMGLEQSACGWLAGLCRCDIKATDSAACLSSCKLSLLQIRAAMFILLLILFVFLPDT